mgnify:CR=1 FL=1
MSTKFTILGCGSSIGVPRIDGFFGKCDPKNPKNLRSRCSAAITTKNLNILIDTSPDLRSQLLSNKIKNINNVFYTHLHADQTHGINDLRLFFLKNKKRIPIFADLNTTKYLKNNFAYCFKKNNGYPATLTLNKLKKTHFFKDINNKVKIKSIIVKHGNIDCICYIINDVCAYASDVSHIFDKDLKHFKNLKYLIIDCLRYKKHSSHFNLNDVLNLVSKIKPKKTILTNLNNEMDYLTLIKVLPSNIIPAHDGLTFNI